jgi:hypothetical protein
MPPRPHISPLAAAVETAAELLREMRTAGAHETADRVCADLAAAQRVIAALLDAELASARTLQPSN